MSEIVSEGYSVYVGSKAFVQLNSFLSVNDQYSQYFLLVDENTLRDCLPFLLQEVPALKDAEIIEIESGEAHKTIEIVTQVWMAMSDSHADRKCLFVNLGGGVIGDMGGFIASTYKRGVDFLNIPTTLLSQVDASVGGKLGIDLQGLKNQIGVFNYPKGVYVFEGFLQSLPFEQLRSGFAEVLKHALIKDLDYWEQVKILDLKGEIDWKVIIEHSVKIKNQVVLNDPREKGERKLLNFGHTIGHAVETFHLERPGLQTFLHGEAIAIGMIAEAYLSHIKQGLNESELKEVSRALYSFFPLPRLAEEYFESFLSLMAHDKKNEGGKINFSLLNNIGNASWDIFCGEAEIIEALNYYNEIVEDHE